MNSDEVKEDDASNVSTHTPTPTPTTESTPIVLSDENGKDAKDEEEVEEEETECGEGELSVPVKLQYVQLCPKCPKISSTEDLEKLQDISLDTVIASIFEDVGNIMRMLNATLDQVVGFGFFNAMINLERQIHQCGEDETKKDEKEVLQKSRERLKLQGKIDPSNIILRKCVCDNK